MQYDKGFSPTVKVGACVICREDPEAGPTVAGLSKVKVDSVDTIFALLQVNSFIHLPTHLLNHSLARLRTHPLMRPPTHMLIQTPRPPTYLLTNSPSPSFFQMKDC